ncbi:putative transcriptional regulator [Desulfitobacterium dehalogenans ATCC 51507]|uniref:Helix-turn-helix domain-containing protein n=2 Tax=Desulfitobacterium dehalogenans TaxID=36854 RepID=A0A7C7DBF2_9FIRM|nr:helix-turn-helix domain-containing protein [Desulfitobacterium dehalogenans]AFL98583.1 putative transcriptional regulator [Desulfitobacterium dehalogenans ATCC 51507]HHY28039.1 helix-turn-helix domain-containing protein [Desulfitobacterium dehalogenans]
MELNPKRLGGAIKNARLENNLTQEELAERVDIATVHMKQLEAGSRKPSVDVLYKLARFLNFSVDAVFFPERTEGRELQRKIERSLNSCSLHELHVIYSTMIELRRILSSLQSQEAQPPERPE